MNHKNEKHLQLAKRVIQKHESNLPYMYDHTLRSTYYLTDEQKQIYVQALIDVVQFLEDWEHRAFDYESWDFNYTLGVVKNVIEVHWLSQVDDLNWD